jgi:hypothetical protein
MGTVAEIKKQAGGAASGGNRVVTRVASLRELSGAHPDALLRIYEAGAPTDPADLGDEPRGMLLALAVGADVFLAVRPLARALGGALVPWKGKVFDHGGNGGANRVLGRHVARFRAERAASAIDGAPTLALRYDTPAFGNPWPLRSLVDELRTVADGIAIGPALAPIGGALRPLFWFGLARG